MKSYTEKHLGKNEEIVRKAKRNWLAIIVVLIKTTLKGLPIVGLLVAAFITGNTTFILSTLIGNLIVFAVAILNFLFAELVITSRRVTYKKGIFSSTMKEYPIEQIETVELSRPFFGKIFNYSFIKISNGGDAKNFMAFDYLKGGEAFRSELSSSVEALKEERAKKQAELQAAEMAKVFAAMNANKQ